MCIHNHGPGVTTVETTTVLVFTLLSLDCLRAENHRNDTDGGASGNHREPFDGIFSGVAENRDRRSNVGL